MLDYNLLNTSKLKKKREFENANPDDDDLLRIGVEKGIVKKDIIVFGRTCVIFLKF